MCLGDVGSPLAARSGTTLAGSILYLNKNIGTDQWPASDLNITSPHRRPSSQTKIFKEAQLIALRDLTLYTPQGRIGSYLQTTILNRLCRLHIFTEG